MELTGWNVTLFFTTAGMSSRSFSFSLGMMMSRILLRLAATAFSDGFHPTPYGHQLMSQLVSRSLAQAGWL